MQSPLVSVMETCLVSLFEPLVSLLEPSFEQPKLPATTSVIMTALKPIDMNLRLQKFLYTNSPDILPADLEAGSATRAAATGAAGTVTVRDHLDPKCILVLEVRG